MSAKRIAFLKNFKILNELEEEFMNEIKSLWVNKSNAIIVSNNDKVFAFGNNKYGVLGFGDCNEVKELTINEKLSYKQIIDFKNSYSDVIARTADGRVYCWGYKCEKIYEPKLIEYLNKEQIIDICCGGWHSLALTNNGEVYEWGSNLLIFRQKSDESYDSRFLPIKVIGFDFETDKVAMISCGLYHSMALTESGRVYSWDYYRKFDNRLSHESDKPKLVELSDDIVIKKISCGREHSLFLTSDGDIYWLENIGFIHKEICPIDGIKFKDIATHYNYKISFLLSKDDIYYTWGNLRDEQRIPIPVETSIKSFQSLFAIYFQITYNYYQIYDQFLESIAKINSNKYELKFTEQKIISSDYYGIVCKAVENESKNEFMIRKIPVSEDHLEKIVEEIKKFEKLWAKYVVNCSNFWIEENYFLRKNFKLDKKSNLNPSHDIFNTKNSILLHIQMELCYKTISETIQILNTELNQTKYEIMSPLGYYIASEIFIELLECIKYLLEKNINPRALKPENIWITCGENGRFVKFADFGLDTIHVFEEQSHPKDSKMRINIKPEAMHSKLCVKKIDLGKCHEFEGQSHSKDTKTRLYSEIEVKDSKYFDLKLNIDIFVSIIQDLFNIDIKKKLNPRKGSLICDKYEKIFELINRMIEMKSESKPNCEEILAEKSFWALSLGELMKENEIKMINENIKIEECFHLFFIQIKLKYDCNSKEDKCIIS